MTDNVVIFDKPYSDEKIAEGRAIQWAVVSGACNWCKYLPQCEKDENFEFPPDAPCMLKKLEFLSGAKMDGERKNRG